MISNEQKANDTLRILFQQEVRHAIVRSTIGDDPELRIECREHFEPILDSVDAQTPLEVSEAIDTIGHDCEDVEALYIVAFHDTHNVLQIAKIPLDY